MPTRSKKAQADKDAPILQHLLDTYGAVQLEHQLGNMATWLQMENSDAYDFTVISNKSKLKTAEEKARAYAKALVTVDAMVERPSMEALEVHPIRPMIQSGLRMQKIDFSKCGVTAKELLALLKEKTSEGEASGSKKRKGSHTASAGADKKKKTTVAESVEQVLSIVKQKGKKKYLVRWDAKCLKPGEELESWEELKRVTDVHGFQVAKAKYFEEVERLKKEEEEDSYASSEDGTDPEEVEDSDSDAKEEESEKGTKEGSGDIWEARMKRLFDAMTAQSVQGKATSSQMADMADWMKEKGEVKKDSEPKEKKDSFDLYGGRKEGHLKLKARHEEMGHEHFESWMRIQEARWKTPTQGDEFQKEVDEASEEFSMRSWQ